jgi:hypothetical protein
MKKYYEQLRVRNDVLQSLNNIVMNENLTLRKHLSQLEEKIKVLEKVVEDNVIRSLTKHE